MTPITALGSRYGIQGALGRSVKRASSASTWWDLDDTITSCVGAWQPKGAASYTASKVNLTGDTDVYMTDHTSYPTWDTGTGWSFSADNARLIVTGLDVSKDQSWSFIARYANQGAADYGGIFNNNASSGYTIVLNPRRISVNLRRYCYGTTNVNRGSYSASGVIALAGRQPYFDGSTDGDALSEYSTTGTTSLILGGLTLASHPWYGDVIALAVYNAVLTSTQIADLNTAINAL